MKLTRPQIAALRSLGEPGHYRVGGLRGVLSDRGYLQLRAAGLIEEQWTFLSTTRPDVGISPKGVTALAELGYAVPAANDGEAT